MPTFNPRIVLVLVLSSLMGTINAAQDAVEPLQKLSAVADKPPAPNFTLSDSNGKAHSLSGYQGKVVIVNFWAVWCAPCRKEMPSMQRSWEQLRTKDTVLLAVNWGDSAKAVDEFLNSLPVKVDFPILLGGDRDMTTAWGVKGLPTSFIIDPKGRIAYRVAGELKWDDPQFLEKVLALKSE